MQAVKNTNMSGKLAGANFNDANIRGAAFLTEADGGLNQEQLYSTSSYKAKDLKGS